MKSTCLAIAVVLGVGCGGGGGGTDGPTTDANDIDAVPPADARPDADIQPIVLYHPLPGLDDATVAQMALQRLGAPVPGADNRCQGCHAITNAHVKQWGVYSDAAFPCLTGINTNSPASALAGLQCLRDLSPTGVLEPRGLGIWSSAARLQWFELVFNLAYEVGSPEYHAFLDDVSMPPTLANTFEQGELDVVAEWFVRGLPLIDVYLPKIGPTDCTPDIQPEVAVRVNDLATTGWRAVNESNLLSMFGCAGAPTTLDCLGGEPRATERTYSATWEVAPGQLRLLAELPGYSSAFWTRTSADGRFVAHGGGDGPGGSTIIDLVGDHHIGVDAAYDPAFFPDNSGFVFQGASQNTCAQSILLGAPAQISMATSPACNPMGIGLYQHLGRRVGSDYFAISGNFVTDNGGVGDDPWAFNNPTDFADILPMIFDGTSYQAHVPTSITLSYEGDAVISPSTRMMVTRRGNMDGRHISFVLHAINATPNGLSYDITSPEIATYCMSGGKPSFSYDERWLTFHHVMNPDSDADAIDLGFTGIGDPAYQTYRTQGTSNIYLLDLVTGVKERITMMGPGQFAYFPHFRSDGWIYFIERDGVRETIVGSDYQLRVE
jgi:hypothetical protein